MSFIHNLGSQAKSISTGIQGIITNRSESLYGCNRYYIQPKVGKDMKLPDGYWVDEADVKFISQDIEHKPKNTGGPLSGIR